MFFEFTYFFFTFSRYREAVDEYMNLLIGREEPTEDEMYLLKSTLKKVECFYSCHNMSNCTGLWANLFDLVNKYKEASAAKEETIPEEAAKSALCACYFGLVWDLHNIQSTTERDSTANDVNGLKARLDKYMEAVQEILLGNISG